LIAEKIFQSPARTLIFGFLVIIVAGTILLNLPVCQVKQISIIDTIFISTSAVCVTGLVTLDISSEFTVYGQLVILLLIQIGGLSFMTFSTFILFLFNKKLKFKQKQLISTLFADNRIYNIKQLIIHILTFTFIFEFIGAVLLSLVFYGEEYSLNSIYKGIFHSISAFCNAGFSLFSDSFSGFKSSLLLNFTVCTLIIFGGLGFFVSYEFFEFLRKRKRLKNLSLHSKIVLSSTAVLIISGTVLIFIFEYNNSINSLDFPRKIIVSFFQSVTSRTAGFNTINIGVLTNSVLSLIIVLMFIGAGSGSCAGGIKITTASVLFKFIGAQIRRRKTAAFFKREIPFKVVSKSFLIFTISIMVILFGTIFLEITQLEGISHIESRGKFLEILFETTSAFGTVGLSTGITPTLNSIGKIIIIIIMLIGRLGPLSIVFAFNLSEKRVLFKYPEENVIVG